MDVGSLLAQLENADLVRRVAEEERAYWFKHALTQDAAYLSLLYRTRREIHQRVAQAYEQLYPNQLDEYVELLALHYAEAGDPAKTIEYSIKAAEISVRHFGYVEASMHYARALDAFKSLPDTDDNRRRRVDTINNYIEFSWGTTVPQENLKLAAEAEALAFALQNADASQENTRRLARVHLMMAAMNLARNEYKEVLRYARQGLEESERLGDERLLITPSAQLGAVLVLQGHFREAAPYLERAIALSAQNPDRWEWSWSVGFLAIAHAMHGQIHLALAEAEGALERVEEIQYHVGICQSLAYLLPVLFAQGDMMRLLDTSRRTVELATRNNFHLVAAIGLGFQALAQSQMGEHQAAEAAMAASLKIAARVGGRPMMSDWLAAANAEIQYNVGKFDEALELANQVVAAAHASGGKFAEAWAERVWGQTLAQLQPPRWDEVEQHLKKSLDAFQECDAVFEVTRTQRILEQVKFAPRPCTASNAGHRTQ